MTMPAFTADASLYATSGRYWTNRYATTPPPGIANGIHPAEIIEVHGCAPGTEVVNWDDGTWSCESVGPNPGSWDEGGGGGIPEVEGVEARPPKGGGGTPRRGKTRRRTRRPARAGRQCLGKDVGGDLMKAELDCLKQGKPLTRELRCFDNPDGTVEAICCHKLEPKNPESELVCLGS